MSEAVVTVVLTQLGTLLTESITNEVRLLSGVNDQINRAKAELQRMRCFLKDADARARGGDERVRNWVAEIREATSDLEDVILIFSSRAVPRREAGFANVIKRLACLFCEGAELHVLGSKIARIADDISALRTSMEAYGVRQLENGDGAISERQRELRRTYSHVVEHDVVGLDNDIEALLACLTEEGKPHRAVSICGMGGLGKTTLGQKVYQHNGIRGHFDRVAWASISQQCQVSSVWKEILVKLCPEAGESPEAEVCRKLYNVQKERKCLIVLDDIWTSETWDRLSPAFPRDETTSKILLTTRNKDVAFHVDGNGIIHERQCLDEKQSWELFEKIFRGSTTTDLTDEDEERKKRLGKDMLKHCGGLPLAIIVLRGLLSQKKQVFEWEAIQTNAKMYINEGKVSELRDSNYSGVSWVLGLSYDELPYQLKPCFLNLALFPEDYEINVAELCQMWMAEGLVSSEDIGYECLNELIQRCMVQSRVVSLVNNRTKTCQVHDLMRDLCLLKAKSENFLQTVNVVKVQDARMRFTKSAKVRRVSVTFSSNDELKPIIKGSCLRSIFLFSPSHARLKMKISWFNSFRFLRVLRFERLQLKSIPKGIEKLIHLRFLSLKGSYISSSLPSSICKLRCLETIDLQVADFSSEPLKNVVNWRLKNLRHLYLPSYFAIRKDILSFEDVTTVRTLVGVSTSYMWFSQLAELTNLTKLKLKFDRQWRRGDATFNNLRSLTLSSNYLSEERMNILPHLLSCPRIFKLKVEGWIEKLPEYTQFSPEFVKITLKRTNVGNDVIPVLEKLPKLRVLRLSGARNVAKIVCTKRGFPRLESLGLSDLRLFEWSVEEGGLPSLSHLTLDHVNGLIIEDHGYGLTIIPSLKYVTTLNEIVVDKKKLPISFI